MQLHSQRGESGGGGKCRKKEGEPSSGKTETREGKKTDIKDTEVTN